MSQDEKDTAETPKKSNKMLMIIVVVAVVLLGGGAGAFFMTKKGDAAEAAPVKGAVATLDESLTVNLADGHYLKFKFALRQTADAAEAVDLSEARNMAIDQYTGRTVAELSTEKGRETLKEELLAKIVKAYTEDGQKMVMDMYYTEFVTQ